MEHTGKMVLVNPGLLETLRPTPPPLTNSLDRVLGGYDVEMSSVLNRTDLEEGD